MINSNVANELFSVKFHPSILIIQKLIVKLSDDIEDYINNESFQTVSLIIREVRAYYNTSEMIDYHTTNKPNA
jgi:hypothetical protein